MSPTLGTLSCWRALKLERVNPCATPGEKPGVLDPKRPLKPKRTRDQSRIEESEGGSITLRELHVKRLMKEAAKEAAAKETAARKEATADKKRQLQESHAALEAAFDLCSRGCRCGQEPCPMAKKQRCPHCKEIKNGECRKQACRAAAAPLRLTHTAATP